MTTAAEHLLHWESVDIHRREKHEGEWETCEVESCREARDILTHLPREQS